MSTKYHSLVDLFMISSFSFQVYIYFCKPEELDDFKSMELPKKKTSSDDSCDYMNENIVKQNSESNEEIIVESVEPWWGEQQRFIEGIRTMIDLSTN